MSFLAGLNHRSSHRSDLVARGASDRVRHRRRKPAVRRALTLDSLEKRIVLSWPTVGFVLSGTASTTLGGSVYYDLDANGSRGSGEDGIADWTVYLDLDHSGSLNEDAEGVIEPTAVTNADGDFVFTHLQPGTYVLSQIIAPGWRPTSLAARDVVVVGDKDASADFFNFAGGQITGVVWSDLNNDGERATDPITGTYTEPGLAGWTVFLDFDHNNQLDPLEPSTTTDISGAYRFTDLPADEYRVTEILPDGWEPASGFDSKQDVFVVPLAESVQDYGNISLGSGSIRGTIWHDENIDGDRATDPSTGEFTEPGLAGWTVFLDLNLNEVADPLEPTTLTDAYGVYTFLGIGEGTYQLKEVLPAGWYPSPDFATMQTVDVMAGDTTDAEDFANFTVLNGSIRGVVWNDVNRSGARDTNLSGDYTEPGLADWKVYLDLNRNGVPDAPEPVALTDANGVYVFEDLQVGEYDVREVLPSGWETAPTFSEDQSIRVFSGLETLAADFANFNISTAIPGSISGVVWDDVDGDGRRDVDPTTGAFTDPGIAGWTIYLDLDANGVMGPSEPVATSGADGSYTFSAVAPGSVKVVEAKPAGWTSTSPLSAAYSFALKNGQNITGIDFGNRALRESGIRGTVFADTNRNGVRDAGERGLGGLTVYLDLNSDGRRDPSEPETTTSSDLFFTPAVNEAGSYSFTHLAAGLYPVRVVVPAELSATPASELLHVITLGKAEDRAGVDTASVFRANEIHGLQFDDKNGNHQRDADEPGVPGSRIYVDLNRNDSLDPDEPTTLTSDDGSYSFPGLEPGAYVIRQIIDSGHQGTYPSTTGGTLWPDGTSNPAVGNVSPGSITLVLANGETRVETVSLTLPGTGALTDLVDVFLLFDDTGSFVNNSPIVRAAFPDIIAQLQSALPGIDLGFGVGRFEEYANFASEYSTGRPFTLNQPIVAASTAGYMSSIQAALNRTTPGYGGDLPETDIEALYQLVTGLGFDGNNNGSVLDSGQAGQVSTQLHPGSSGDVPSFASFLPDMASSVFPAAGNVGGGGFRAGALPIVLVATDTGFAYQPRGETTIVGAGGVSLPISAFTQTSRPTTPFNSGAGIQQTVTALNSLGALVIGLGTNSGRTVDPRMGLEALSIMTGAVNRSTSSISNGTTTPIAPGDPLYFQIASGFASSVATGITNAIANAVTNVAIDLELKASDPRVRIINQTGVRRGIASGQTAMFDIQFVGDGVPRRFDLQFVRSGTDVVLGSIPVVLGTQVPGDGYEFEDAEEGEIRFDVDFGTRAVDGSPPTDILVSNSVVTENKPVGTVVGVLSASDPDSGQTFTYSLIAGAGDSGNASFAIVGDQLLTNAAIDFEAVAAYSIRVSVTDQSGLSFEKSFVVDVSNVNEISGFQVQRGAKQRSYIRYVDLVFESMDGLSSLITDDRISLTKYDLNGEHGVVVPLPSGVMTVESNGIAFNFGRQGLGGNRLTAAGDGYYVLSVDEDGDGQFDSTRRFYRLLGDANGDRAVTQVDAATILAAYGQMGTNLNADITGDGIVNALDRTLALRQRNRRLKSTLKIDA